MAFLKNKNFAFSRLAASITDIATSLTVTTGEGTLFPATGDFMCVIWGDAYSSPNSDNSREIVKMTLSSGDIFTIIRAQEGTTAKAWDGNSKIALVITAGKVDELETNIDEKIVKTTPILEGELDCQAHSIGFTQGSATGDGTTTIDWKLGNKFKFTFGAFNETFTFTSPTKPGNFLLMLIQDATGSRTATWPAAVKWPGGTAPTLSTAANAIDIISMYFDGTNYYAQSGLNFS